LRDETRISLSCRRA